ncbi:hypothetical protein CTA1_3361 [Colletotrichum tanaceti]|uniref:Uncharacterized protein n=1 Tax=Colletotrichum tanaceti TaxID=1306861 RepID=A0A4U6XDR0_9PEZI|nr:hypothetical protein CTA1_3361 [Colletotrichum tanaceti]
MARGPVDRLEWNLLSGCWALVNIGPYLDLANSPTERQHSIPGPGPGLGAREARHGQVELSDHGPIGDE